MAERKIDLSTLPEVDTTYAAQVLRGEDSYSERHQYSRAEIESARETMRIAGMPAEIINKQKVLLNLAAQLESTDAADLSAGHREAIEANLVSLRAELVGLEADYRVKAQGQTLRRSPPPRRADPAPAKVVKADEPTTFAGHVQREAARRAPVVAEPDSIPRPAIIPILNEVLDWAHQHRDQVFGQNRQKSKLFRALRSSYARESWVLDSLPLDSDEVLLLELDYGGGYQAMIGSTSSSSRKPLEPDTREWGRAMGRVSQTWLAEQVGKRSQVTGVPFP